MQEEEILNRYFVGDSPAQKIVIEGAVVYFANYSETLGNSNFELVTAAKAYVIHGNIRYLFTAKSIPEDAKETGRMLLAILKTIKTEPPGN